MIIKEYLITKLYERKKKFVQKTWKKKNASVERQLRVPHIPAHSASSAPVYICENNNDGTHVHDVQIYIMHFCIYVQSGRVYFNQRKNLRRSPIYRLHTCSLIVSYFENVYIVYIRRVPATNQDIKHKLSDVVKKRKLLSFSPRNIAFLSRLYS